MTLVGGNRRLISDALDVVPVALYLRLDIVRISICDERKEFQNTHSRVRRVTAGQVPLQALGILTRPLSLCRHR